MNDDLVRYSLSRIVETRAAVQSTKAPPGALSNIFWNTPGQPVYPDFSGEAAIDLAYLRHIWTYRCIDTISNTIASWPFRAGDQVTFNYRLTYPLAQLLGPSGDANPNLSSASLLRYAVAQYLLMGKFAWRIERSGADIVGLWPLQVQYLFPVYATSGANYFSYFKYGTIGHPGYQEFDPTDVVYVYRPSLKDFRQPESPIQAASVNINIAKMLDQFDYSFLKNGGVPAHLIITPPFETDDDRDNFQEQFIADFVGPANVGHAAFAERKVQPGEQGTTQMYDTVDVKTIGVAQKDAQLDSLRDAEIMATCVAWGVPVSILGDSSRRTFSNATDERVNYLQHTCAPRAREIQSGINKTLAKMLDPTMKTVGWFDVTGVPELRPAPVLPDGPQAAAIQAAGAFLWDEWRAERGLPPQAHVGLSTAVSPAPAAIDAGADVLPPASAPATRADVRHSGPDHEHIPTGHITKSTLEQAMTKALQSTLDEMAKTVKDRATGKRARRGEDIEYVNVPYWSSRIMQAINAGLSENKVTIHQVEDALLRIWRDGVTAEELIGEWTNEGN